MPCKRRAKAHAHEWRSLANREDVEEAVDLSACSSSGCSPILALVATNCPDMNIRLQAVLFFVLAPYMGAAFCDTPGPSVQDQLRPLLDEMIQAANAHDTDRFMSVYVHSPTLIVTFDDLTMHGWQTVRDQQLQWWNNGNSDAVYRLRSAPEITVISPDVVATLQSMDVSSTGPSGAKASMLVVATSVWKKLPEGWRIVLAHESLVD